MIITLNKVKTEQKQIFKNLMSLYLHDLSEFDHSLDLNNELLIEFDAIDLFFKEDDLDVFYILL